MKSRMPINFEKTDLTFPFKIYAKVEDKKLYVAVEKLSILYDYFNDKVIEIKNIGKFLQSPNNQSIQVYLVVNLTQKATVITSAEIILSGPIPPLSEVDNDGYVKKITTQIGSADVSPSSGEIITSQNVLSNLTKYACGTFISEIL